MRNRNRCLASPRRPLSALGHRCRPLRGTSDCVPACHATLQSACGPWALLNGGGAAGPLAPGQPTTLSHCTMQTDGDDSAPLRQESQRLQDSMIKKHNPCHGKQMRVHDKSPRVNVHKFQDRKGAGERTAGCRSGRCSGMWLPHCFDVTLPSQTA